MKRKGREIDRARAAPARATGPDGEARVRPGVREERRARPRRRSRRPAPSALQVSRYRTSDTTVLTVPMAAKLTSRRPKSSSSAGRADGPRSSLPRPAANVRTIRAVPTQVVVRGAGRRGRGCRRRRSSRPAPRGCAARCARRGAAARCRRTSRRPRPRGAARRATSVRTALKPHCASRTRVASTVRRIRLYVREMSSRFGARATDEPGARRDPIARSE